MQILHDHQTVLSSVRYMRDIGVISMEVSSSDAIEVKEKRSSNVSFMMNPVASGDNMATGLNSAHKLKEELPPLIPCCEGRELQINENLIRTGLSAISVKHDSVIQCLSMSQACERLQVPPGLIKHRNSFRSLHRPDLKRVPYLRRMNPDELETIFRGYADLPSRESFKCASREKTESVLSPNGNVQTKDLRDKEMLEGTAAAYHPIPEARSGSENLPQGMRLHVTRARLYTSVLAGVNAGDQPEGCAASTEDLDNHVPVDIVPEDEVPLKEEVQYIMPPRCDDVSADSSKTGNADLRIIR